MPTRSLESLDRKLAAKPDYERAAAESAPWEALADRLIAYRVESGLSQTELARRCGTTQSAIARLEQGEHVPRLETLAKIAHALEGGLVLMFESRGERHELVTL